MTTAYKLRGIIHEDCFGSFDEWFGINTAVRVVRACAVEGTLGVDTAVSISCALIGPFFKTQ